MNRNGSDQLEDAGIEVVFTNLEQLRDSTPLYSGLYRTIFRWVNFEKEGWIANAMASEAPKMTVEVLYDPIERES